MHIYSTGTERSFSKDDHTYDPGECYNTKCLKISLGLFKTLLKDLSLKKEKEKVTNLFLCSKERDTTYFS